MKDDERKTSPDAGPKRAEPARPSGDSGTSVIPPEGSLGLLALGAVGITEWRYARERAKQEAKAAESDDVGPEDASQGEETAAEDE